MRNNDDSKLLLLLDEKYLPKWYKDNINFKSKLLLKDYLNYWLNDYHKKEIKLNTFLSYENSINKYIIPYLGDIPLKELSPDDLKSFYSYLKNNKKLSDNNIKCIHRCLSKALSDAVFLMYITINPLDYIDKLPSNKTNLNFLSTKDICRLEIELSKDKDNVYFLPTLLGIKLGLRRGEILGLKYCDVDNVNKLIKIERSYLMHGKDYYLSSPKTKNSKRVIKLDDEVLKEINYKKNKYKCNDNDFICINPNTNKIINYYSWRKYLNCICDKINIPRIRIHDLRHANATMMLNSGISMKEASMRLGHSTINTTMDIYSHIDKDADKSASLSIEELLLK